MNYKNLLMAIALVAALVLVGCSQVPKEKTLTVSNVSISGDVKDFVKVPDGNYIVKTVGDKVALAVTMELDSLFPGLNTAITEQTWKLTPLDEAGAALVDIEPFILTTPKDKVEGLLGGGLGETAIVSFEWGQVADKAKQKRIMAEMAGFEITGADLVEAIVPAVVEEVEEVATNTTTTKPKPKPPVVKPPVVANEWDAVLDSYETYVNRTIALANKVKRDPTAMKDFIKMKEQAENTAARMEAASNMTSAQLSRFTSLKNKLKTALDNM